MKLPPASKTTYRIGRRLHWLAAVIFIVMVVGTDIWTDFAKTSDQREVLYFWHIGLGYGFCLLLFVRIGWMIRYPELMTRFATTWQALVARTNHYALYFLMAAMPLSGMVGELWEGERISLFGLLPIYLSDSVLAINEGILADEIAEWCEEIHIFLKWPIYLLLSLHIAGATMHWLKHQFKSSDA
jgi:cytochrome b561